MKLTHAAASSRVSTTSSSVTLAIASSPYEKRSSSFEVPTSYSQASCGMRDLMTDRRSAISRLNFAFKLGMCFLPWLALQALPTSRPVGVRSRVVFQVTAR